MIDKIKGIIAGQLQIEAEEIADDSDIVDDLGADSLDIVTFVMTIEDSFGISIPDEAIPELKTPKSIAEYVEKNI